MKKFSLLAIVAIAAVSMTSCKSKKTLSEAATIATPGEKVEEVASTVQTISRRSAPDVQAGDRQEKVSVVGDGLLKDYNVVVGSFGSKDNALNMKSTMQGRGYNSFIVQNAAGMYRVVAGGYDTREAATAIRDVIRSTYANETGTCADAWLLIPAI